MKRAVFIDEAVQREYDCEGIVRLPLVTASEIDTLREKFLELHPQFTDTMNQAYYVSVFGGDAVYRRRIYDSFVLLLKPALDRIFNGYKILAVIAQVKGTSSESRVNIHQDLTVVDESKYFTCTFWIPLSDSNLNNGAIYALNRSQQVFRNFRAHTLDYQFGKVQDFILSNSKPYVAAKGEALAFDPACIHYSPPNVTAQPRLSLALSIVPAEAPVQIGYYDKEAGTKDMEVYDVPDNFWYLYNDFMKERLDRPAFGTLNGMKENAVETEYDAKEFIDKYNALVS